jgi:hypothetical protein
MLSHEGKWKLIQFIKAEFIMLLYFNGFFFTNKSWVRSCSTTRCHRRLSGEGSCTSSTWCPKSRPCSTTRAGRRRIWQCSTANAIWKSPKLKLKMFWLHQYYIGSGDLLYFIWQDITIDLKNSVNNLYTGFDRLL